MMHKTLSEYKSAVKQINFPPQAKEVQYLMRISLYWRRDKAIFFKHLQDKYWARASKLNILAPVNITSFNASFSYTCMLCLSVCNSS